MATCQTPTTRLRSLQFLLLLFRRNARQILRWLRVDKAQNLSLYRLENGGKSRQRKLQMPLQNEEPAPESVPRIHSIRSNLLSQNIKVWTRSRTPQNHSDRKLCTRHLNNTIQN